MPELKHTFRGGKMNKDLDERIVPNGEYRDAMNISVSTSEDSDVGAAQNILGNTEISECVSGPVVDGVGIYRNSNKHVGHIVDKQHDKVYRFIHTNADFTNHGTLIGGVKMDRIVEYDLAQPRTNPAVQKETAVAVDVYEVRTIIHSQQDCINADTMDCDTDIIQHVNIKHHQYQIRWGMQVIFPNMLGGWHVDPEVYVERVQYTGGFGGFAKVYFSKPLHKSEITAAFGSDDLTGKDIWFQSKRALHFGDGTKPVTGINVIDKMLFWTDDRSEPKKVNIERGIKGSQSQNLYAYDSFDRQTLLIKNNKNPKDCFKPRAICRTSFTASYDCDGKGTCYDPGTGLGAYSTFGDCSSNCFIDTWDCDGTGGCVLRTDGSGTYTVESDCLYQCTMQGCTDPVASNYNPYVLYNSGVDDGSCAYQTMVWTECTVANGNNFLWDGWWQGPTFQGPNLPNFYVVLDSADLSHDTDPAWYDTTSNTWTPTQITNFMADANAVTSQFVGGASVWSFEQSNPRNGCIKIYDANAGVDKCYQLWWEQISYLSPNGFDHANFEILYTDTNRYTNVDPHWTNSGPNKKIFTGATGSMTTANCTLDNVSNCNGQCHYSFPVCTDCYISTGQAWIDNDNPGGNPWYLAGSICGYTAITGANTPIPPVSDPNADPAPQPLGNWDDSILLPVYDPRLTMVLPVTYLWGAGLETYSKVYPATVPIRGEMDESGKPCPTTLADWEYLNQCRPMYMQEKHITVIRKGPTKPLDLELYTFNPTARSDQQNTFATASSSPGFNTVSGGIIDLTGRMAGISYYGNDTALQTDPAVVPYDARFPNGYNTTGLTYNTSQSWQGENISIFFDVTGDLKLVGDQVWLPIDIATTGEDWEVGDELLISGNVKNNYGVNISVSAFLTVDAFIPGGNELPWATGINQTYNIPPMIECTLNGITPNMPIVIKSDDVFEVTLIQKPPMFEFKFPRFSYRYKYEDGEYSTFAPWSEIAFLPGDFDYLPRKGYNLGMVNNIRSINLLNWRPKSMPHDVTEIDVLYKESNSPNVYSVETFSAKDNPTSGSMTTPWERKGTGGNYGRYKVTSELIHAVVPSEQMLRPWDNVPRKAKAQEITANRLIYANYLQNYDLIDWVDNPVVPKFQISIDKYSTDDVTSIKQPGKSLKSMRTYQLGIVYRDKYGRETPVLTSQSGSFKLGKDAADKYNRIRVKTTTYAPTWADSFTYYIKDTANEYYNVCLNNFYEAEDGQLWLSFPSSERNKVNEDTTLIFKKQHDSDVAVLDESRYKVLDVQNSAPRFVRTFNQYWGAVKMTPPPAGWGVGTQPGTQHTGMFLSTGLPVVGQGYLDVVSEYWDQSVLAQLYKAVGAKIRIVQTISNIFTPTATSPSTIRKSLWYDIVNVNVIGSPPETMVESVAEIDSFGNPTGYSTEIQTEVPGSMVQITRVTLRTSLGEDARFCESQVPGGNALVDGLYLEVKTDILKDKSQFEGVFFVKIGRDATLETNLVKAKRLDSTNYTVLESKDIYYLQMGNPGLQDWNLNGNSPVASKGKAYTVEDTTPQNDQYVNYTVSPPDTSGNQWPGGAAKNKDIATNTLFCNYFGTGQLINLLTDTQAGVVTANHTDYYAGDWPSVAGDIFDLTGGGGSRGDFMEYHVISSYSDKALEATFLNVNGAVMAGGIPHNVGLGGNLATDPCVNCWPYGPGAEWNSTHHHTALEGGSGAVSTSPKDAGPYSDPPWHPTGHAQFLNRWDVAGMGPVPADSSTVENDWPSFWPDWWSSKFAAHSSWDGIPHDPTAGSSGFFMTGNYGFNSFNRPAIWGDNLINTWTPSMAADLRKHWDLYYRGKEVSGVAEWPDMKNDFNRWFIDKVGAAKGYSGAGIWDGMQVSYMQISYWGIGNRDGWDRDHNMYTHQQEQIVFSDSLGTAGTMFRFKQDPDQTVYTITNSAKELVYNYEPPAGVWGHSRTEPRPCFSVNPTQTNCCNGSTPPSPPGCKPCCPQAWGGAITHDTIMWGGAGIGVGTLAPFFGTAGDQNNYSPSVLADPMYIFGDVKHWDYDLSKSLVSGKEAFYSDTYADGGFNSFTSFQYNPSYDPRDYGGYFINYRVRYTLTLNKKIGSGAHAFHPITNHVDADGNANIVGGRKMYDTDIDPICNADFGGTPVNTNAGERFEMYNLSSYWNHNSGTPPTITLGNNYAQPNDKTTNDTNGTYIGLHERGLNATTIEILSIYAGQEDDAPLSNNPAIFETEPKEAVDVDIYYAASPTYPVNINRFRYDPNPGGNSPSTESFSDFGRRTEEVIPVGAKCRIAPNAALHPGTFGISSFAEPRVKFVENDYIWLCQPFDTTCGANTNCTDVSAINQKWLESNLPNGFDVIFTWSGEGRFNGVRRDHYVFRARVIKIESYARQSYCDIRLKIAPDVSRKQYSLPYFNCYSFGNGVESDRIRDDYNAVRIGKGVKVSMPLAEQYKAERRHSGLIFSGIYNSTSGINSLNQFIQANPITKDLNPINGSIQKLFARDTDLVTFCENKIFKILAKKDALFNADGNTNVTSNAQVLGQAIPFTGEYGISKNPESLASESYRLYFADKMRGAILRLSRDGITNISDYGMKDWFKDNLFNAEKIIGSYDDRENQYNVTVISEYDDAAQEERYKADTISYVEKDRGWVSFKAFIQEGGFSHKNQYYTIPTNHEISTTPPGTEFGTELWQHHLDIRLKKKIMNVSLVDFSILDLSDKDGLYVGMNVIGKNIPTDATIVDLFSGMGSHIRISKNAFVDIDDEITFTAPRNNFYGHQSFSSVTVMFNGDQGNVKRYKTINYEGSQAKVRSLLHVEPIGTAITATGYHALHGSSGTVHYGITELDNYGKHGWEVEDIKTDLQEGFIPYFEDKENKWFNYIRGGNEGEMEAGMPEIYGDMVNTSEFSLQGLGFQDKNCSWCPAGQICGCTDNAAYNYDPAATMMLPNSCCYVTGCMDPTSYNWNVNACHDDGNCCYVTGCTDSSAPNYNPSACVDDGSCIPIIYGCTDPMATNYFPGATIDDGTCIYCVYGCMDPTAFNYNPNVTCDDGSCINVFPGCTDPNYVNYNPLANTDDGSCCPCYACGDPAFDQPWGNYGLCNGNGAASETGPPPCSDQDLCCEYHGCANADSPSWWPTACPSKDGPYCHVYIGPADNGCVTKNYMHWGHDCDGDASISYGFNSSSYLGPLTGILAGIQEPFTWHPHAFKPVWLGSGYDRAQAGCNVELLTDRDELALFQQGASSDASRIYKNIKNCMPFLANSNELTREALNTQGIVPADHAIALQSSSIKQELPCWGPDYNTITNNGFAPHDFSSYPALGSAGLPANPAIPITGVSINIWNQTVNPTPIVPAENYFHSTFNHQNWAAQTNPCANVYNGYLNTLSSIQTAFTTNNIAGDPTRRSIDGKKMAFNFFEANWTTDHKECYVTGCMDSGAANYNQYACIDDGSCLAVIPSCPPDEICGCTEAAATNYEPTATFNNGTCTYKVFGCTDSSKANYDVYADTDDGSCIGYVFGCMYPHASNYDPSATMDDGTCNI